LLTTSMRNFATIHLSNKIEMKSWWNNYPWELMKWHSFTYLWVRFSCFSKIWCICIKLVMTCPLSHDLASCSHHFYAPYIIFMLPRKYDSNTLKHIPKSNLICFNYEFFQTIGIWKFELFKKQFGYKGTICSKFLHLSHHMVKFVCLIIQSYVDY